MPTQYFASLEAYKLHLQQMAQSIKPAQRRTWNKNVMGRLIIDLIKLSFLAGKNPEGELWKSSAEETQHNGRWAASYRKRPSGAAVSADMIRLTDTRELVKSYGILSVSPDEVTVGPEGQRNVNIATRAETVWGNIISGWGRIREGIAMRQVERAWECFVTGVPLSRIRKPTLRAY